MLKPHTLSICLAAAYVALIVGFVSSNIWLVDIGKVSQEHQTPVTPAGYAFAIWNVIWILQGISVCWFLVRRKDPVIAEQKSTIVSTIGPWWIGGFVTSCMMVGAFCFLYALFSLEAHPGFLNVPAEFTLSFRGCVSAATAINAAWLIVASAVGIVIVAPQADEALWLGVLIFGLAADIGVYVLYKTKSVSYALTVVWAAAAVYFGQPAYPVVQGVSITVAVVYFVLTNLIVFKRVQGGAATEGNVQGAALLESVV